MGQVQWYFCSVENEMCCFGFVHDCFQVNYHDLELLLLCSSLYHILEDHLQLRPLLCIPSRASDCHRWNSSDDVHHPNSILSTCSIQIGSKMLQGNYFPCQVQLAKNCLRH